jgi:hypothetical protein
MTKRRETALNLLSETLFSSSACSFVQVSWRDSRSRDNWGDAHWGKRRGLRCCVGGGRDEAGCAAAITELNAAAEAVWPDVCHSAGVSLTAT